MKKQEFITHWESITPNQAVKPNAIPYKHEGSTFDCDGIRILGSAKFIDSVLSRMKDLLAYEGSETRLQISYTQATDKNSGVLLDSYKCYIQVHERGGQAIMCNAFVEGLETGDFSNYNGKATKLVNDALQISNQ